MISAFVIGATLAGTLQVSDHTEARVRANQGTPTALDVLNQPEVRLTATTPSVATYRSKDDHEWTYSLIYSPSVYEQGLIGQGQPDVDCEQRRGGDSRPSRAREPPDAPGGRFLRAPEYDVPCDAGAARGTRPYPAAFATDTDHSSRIVEDGPHSGASYVEALARVSDPHLHGVRRSRYVFAWCRSPPVWPRRRGFGVPQPDARRSGHHDGGGDAQRFRQWSVLGAPRQR